jgi:type IV pilus assembly protein PilC
MKIFEYQGLTQSKEKLSGHIDAENKDSAISILQNRGILITSVKESNPGGNLGVLNFLNKVPNKEVVFISRQIATLFEAKVSAFKAFSLIADQAENKVLQSQLRGVTSDISSGSTISSALGAYPDTFSSFL